MFVTRVTSSNNVSPSRGNNEASGTPVRGDVVDLTDDATTSAASNHNGSVDAAPTAHGFVGNFPNVDVGRNRGDLELDVVIAENAITEVSHTCRHVFTASLPQHFEFFAAMWVHHETAQQLEHVGAPSKLTLCFYLLFCGACPAPGEAPP